MIEPVAGCSRSEFSAALTPSREAELPSLFLELPNSRSLWRAFSLEASLALAIALSCALARSSPALTANSCSVLVLRDRALAAPIAPALPNLIS